MTISEASELVIQAGAMSSGGEVYILEMGKPVSILKLAKKIINSYGLKLYFEGDLDKRDIKIEFVGLRKGEKLSEELLISQDVSKTSHPRIIQSNEKTYPYKNLISILNQLKKSCAKNNAKEIKAILEKAKIQFDQKQL